SSYDAGVISQYVWNWGDGWTGYGKTASHTYFSTGAKTYTVTLTVTGTDAKTGTASKSITLSVAGGGTTTTAGDPSARFAITFPNDNDDVAPVEVEFDPEDSEADEGRTIASYTWTFGDGSSTHTVNSTPVTHVYRTDQTSEMFSVTLVVIDDEGNVDSITKTVKVYNYQPTAGFDINDALADNDVVDETDVGEQEDADYPQGEWIVDDVTYNSVQSGSTTVWISSMPPHDTNWDPGPHDELLYGDYWIGEVANPVTQGTASAEPWSYVEYGDNSQCFDPEGQGWDKTDNDYDKTIRPDGWTNAGWGIERIEVNWGDGNTHHYDYFLWVMNGYGEFMHTYAFNGTTATYTITITAHDFLGAQDSFSRTVTLRAGD
ncbi:PKD domain-containing protein, partial [Candidatus Bipolaricaulota bacterium]|nr:PKD domain-containing protein [Candidatus Bipolaricaulota bacterium]